MPGPIGPEELASDVPEVIFEVINFLLKRPWKWYRGAAYVGWDETVVSLKLQDSFIADAFRRLDTLLPLAIQAYRAEWVIKYDSHRREWGFRPRNGSGLVSL